MFQLSYVLFIDEQSYRGEREFFTRQFATEAEARAFELGLHEGSRWDVLDTDSWHDALPRDESISLADHHQAFLDMWSERNERGGWAHLSPCDPRQESESL